MGDMMQDPELRAEAEIERLIHNLTVALMLLHGQPRFVRVSSAPWGHVVPWAIRRGIPEEDDHDDD